MCGEEGEEHGVGRVITETNLTSEEGGGEGNEEEEEEGEDGQHKLDDWGKNEVGETERAWVGVNKEPGLA